ncbi:hypothetical protein BGX31_011436 [Mortierella sp. GBA43]|nr:hypothetical protein BGX31_011436 [Mortierella sp. GBA43]
MGNDRDEIIGGIKAFLPPGFDSLDEYIKCLQEFLVECEPITDLMIVDYFTTNSWETRMPKEWRDAFESENGKLSSLDLMELVSLGNLRGFNQERTSGEPNQQKQTDWPESLKNFVSMVKKLSINRTVDPEFTKFKDTLDIHLIPGMSPKKLHEVEILSGLIASYAKDHSIRSVIDLGAGQGYLSRVLAFQHQLCVLGVDSNTIQTCGAQTTQKRTEKLFVNKSKLKRSGKEPKKESSSSPSRQPNSSQSAGGASSSRSLTTATGAIAASSTSSESMTQPQDGSDSLALVTERVIEVPVETATSKRCKRAKAGAGQPSNSPLESLGESSSANTAEVVSRSSSSGRKPCRNRKSRTRKDETQSACGSRAQTNGVAATTDTEESTICPTASMSVLSTTPTTTTTTTTTTAITTTTITTTTTSNASLASSSISPSVSCTTILSDNPDSQENRPTVADSANDPTLATTPGSNFQLKHITHHITASTLPTLLKEHFPRRSKRSSQCLSSDDIVKGMDMEELDQDKEDRWTLCGLHACGDLTSNMIKLYLESSATCLFSVGCCYHWITERFDKDGNVAISDGTHGFPLSAAFNRHKAHLGGHAKMIACQSPERWLEYQKETEDAIHGHYFRALLHKLMVDKSLIPGPPAAAPVLGRMGKHRLKGFPHYLATAIHRLGLPSDAIKPEEAQAAYDQFLEKDLYRIGVLWALRTMLGPIFEGMILLDRAAYLHETIVGDGTRPQKGSVQLIPGFDVVESPRNMILIALKD